MQFSLFNRGKRNVSRKTAEFTARFERPGMVESLETRVMLSSYFVSTSGSDSAAGTASAPWRTLQKAGNSVKAGDDVTVRAGTYSGGLNLINRTGGTQSAPITFTAEPGVTVTGVGTGSNASMAAINLENAGGWYVIQGFKVVGNSSMQRAAIRVASTTNTVVRNNNVSGAFDGIFASRSDGVVVENNVCANATDEHGIYVNGSRNYVIRGNTTYGSNWDGIHVNISDGVNTVNDGGLIEGNKSYGNALAGIDVDGATNLTIRNNIVYDNWKHGITVYNANQNPTPVSQNVTVVNNTLANNDMYGLQVQSGNAGGMTIFNNAITGNGSGSINMIGSLPSSFKSDYNVLSDKRTTGQDSHSPLSSSSTLFVNPGGGDFHLKSGVVAIDAGTASLNGRSAPTIDFDKAARPQGNGYDVGADEVGSSTPPPTTDTTAPAISGVSASNLTQTAAGINWTTNEGSTSQVQYGTTTSYGSTTTLDSTRVTSHRVNLSGLAAGTTYNYRVISRDAAGNTATSGNFTFTTPAAPPPTTDTTAPAISGVNASGVTASAANVNWTTNEGSTSQVEYGTTTSYGSKTAVNGSMVTGHTVGLSGLAQNTLYNYRVISTDAAGNTAVSGNFTFTTASTPTNPTPTGSKTQTTTTDFKSGDKAGVAITNSAGGELQLRKLWDEQFDGAALGSWWTVNNWSTAGTQAVSNGILSLAGSQVRGDSSFGSVPVTARVAFAAAPYQHVGLATDMADVAGNSWAVFSTNGTTNTLYARVNNNGTTRDVSLGALPTGFHTYRIQPVSGGFSFYVDDVLKTTISQTIASTAMKVTLSAYNASPALQADWIEVPTRVSSGTYNSSVLDAGSGNTWDSASWSANLPAGTSMTVETRTGNSATPDSTWSAWSRVDSAGNITSPAGRYVVYRITLSTANTSVSPTVFDVTLSYV
jgi:parallel beta-helix repeat protein